MRNLFFITIAILFIHQSIAQDKIIKLTGESIFCKVTEITDDIIKYKSVDEDLIRNIQKEKVQKIIFETGKIEEVISRVEIKGEKDWDKVSVTNTEADVDGLFRGEEMKAKTTSRILSANKSVLKMRTLEELKRKAAARGYHMVLLVNHKTRGFHRGGKHGVVSSAVGIGYKYN